MDAQNQNGVITIRLNSSIDALNADNTREEIVSILDRSGDFSKVVLEASELEYISSAGLRVLLLLTRKYNVPFFMTNVNPEIYDIVDKTGFTRILTISTGNDLQP